MEKQDIRNLLIVLLVGWFLCLWVYLSNKIHKTNYTFPWEDKPPPVEVVTMDLYPVSKH